MNTNFYDRYEQMYRKADDDLRAETREHWLKIHKENLDSNRDDLIMFSGQILSRIMIVDNE